MSAAITITRAGLFIAGAAVSIYATLSLVDLMIEVIR